MASLSVVEWTAGVTPIALVAALLLIALVPASTGTAWSRLLPAWIKIVAYDVVTKDDIQQEERRDQEATEQQQQQQQHTSLPRASESTPLIAKPAPHTTPRATPGIQNALLAILALAHLAGTIAIAAYRIETHAAASPLVQAAQIVTWTYALLRASSRHTLTPPYDLFALYTVHLLGSLVSLHADWVQGRRLQTTALPPLLCTIASLAIVVSMPLTDLAAQYPVKPGEQHHLAPAAEDRCTLWQWMTFSWMSPIIDLAVQRTIERQDVWKLSTACRSNLLVRVFKRAAGPTRSLPWRIIAANAHDILLDLLLTLLSSILAYAPPFFLKRILEAIEGKGTTTKSTAYLYAIFSLAAMIFKSQADLQHLFYGRRATIRVRGQLIASIYEKALRTRDMTGSVAAKNISDDNSNTTTTTAPSQPEDANIGKVVSLAAVDSIRIAAQCGSAYFLYSAPIELVVASLFLYNLLGWSAFAGFIVLVFASPLQTRLTRTMIQVSKELSAARDKRLSSLNEVTQNLKFVKYYAFEDEMQRRILHLRDTELAWLRKRQIISSFVMALWTLTPALVTTVSFASYVYIAKRDLDVSTAFTAIALFQLLRGPLNNLPMQINELLNSKVSADRIDEFLHADEVPREVSSISEADRSHFIVDDDEAFGCQDATFQWPAGPVSDLTGTATSDRQRRRQPRGRQSQQPQSLRKAVSRFFKRRLEDEEPHVHSSLLPQSHPPPHPNGIPGSAGGEDTPEVQTNDAGAAHEEPFQLRDITFMPPMGRMTLVIGATGSGKSALLTALLGEMEQVSGRSHLQKDARVHPKTGLSHTIAYCAQTPWLQHASIRQNILFGQPYEHKRYNDVLDVCALRPDLEILDGDATEIGEKGVSLSGGQQARVALARAVYSRAAVVLLDDPLSAVDTHTAAKLVKECLHGPLMKGRTVVLVTHHADLVLGTERSVSWVAKLSEGAIVAQGTAADLTASGDLSESARSNADDENSGDAVPGDEPEEKDANGNAVAAAAAATSTKDGADQASSHPRKLVEEEKRAVGGVKKEVYKMYLDAVGWKMAGLVVLTLVAFKGTDLAEKGWLAVWGASYRRGEEAGVIGIPSNAIWIATSQPGLSAQSVTSHYLFAAHHHVQAGIMKTFNALGTSSTSASGSPFPPAYLSPTPYIMVFFLINIASATLIILSALFTLYGSLQASRSLFKRMLASTMGATTRWLDKTPSGRIVNKFSRDIEVVDTSINSSLRYFASFLIAGVISVLTIIIVLPSFILPTAILGTMNYYVTRGYVRAARDLRRLESISRSPIFSAFSELLQGISTVRAFGAEQRLLRECTDRIDLSNSYFLYFWMSNRWLLFRLDILGAVAIFVATVASLYGTIAAGLAGLALTQAQSLIQAGYWLARFYTTLEQDANSIERIREALDETPQEPASIIEDHRPPAAWPAKGKIEVRDLVLRYAPDLPPVLHGISFTILPGEKVGIVGRTGSGKSTTALAFFRFVEFDRGSIHIDDVDISKIGLYDLRSRLTIIPQNAVLFSGTIRDNLDPFGKHSDEECVRALRAVNIRVGSAGAAAGTATPARDGSGTCTPTPPSQTSVTLDSRVSEGGSNWSQGQRQLLAMARALLRNSQVILMDEASSAVDFSTDTLIQSTIRNGFAHATVITIAHRLHTVAHADKVLVLDQGKVVEYDHPRVLMEDATSTFAGMCRKSGDWDALYASASGRARGGASKVNR